MARSPRALPLIGSSATILAEGRFCNVDSDYRYQFCDYCHEELPRDGASGHRVTLRAVGFDSGLPSVRWHCGVCAVNDEIDEGAQALLRERLRHFRVPKIGAAYDTLGEK